MNRRTFLTTALQAGAALSLAADRNLLAAPALHPLARPTADLTAWQELEFGMFVHIAPNTWQNREYDDLSTPLSAMRADYDTDQWAECALNLGARYVVFVAKHAGGFCMWQTETTPYSIRNTPWKNGKGDVLASLSASCRRRGLKLGVYVSPQDHKFGAGLGGKCATPALQRQYDRMYRQQLTEVLSRYGEMVEVWFDGSTVVPVADIVRRYAPHAAIFQGPEATIRWVGNEMGHAPYPCWNSISRADAATGVATALHGNPDGAVWMPVEVDVSIRRPHWFWNPTDVANLLSEAELLDIYYRSAGRGAQLLLNVPPNTKGRIDDADFARARQFGDEIRRRFGHAVAETSGRGRSLTVTLPRPQRIDHVVLQEDCRLGERVRAYRLEAHAGGRWVGLGDGSAIGHKRIQPVPPMVAEAVRLTVTEAAAEPAIRRLAVFDTAAAPPPQWNAPVHLWAADEAGAWKDGRFRLDLTAKIHVAGQYRLRFVAQGGAAVRVTKTSLTIGGLAQPRLLRAVKGAANELMLDVTGLGQSIVVSGEVRGASAGTVLLQRL